MINYAHRGITIETTKPSWKTSGGYAREVTKLEFPTIINEILYKIPNENTMVDIFSGKTISGRQRVSDIQAIRKKAEDAIDMAVRSPKLKESVHLLHKTTIDQLGLSDRKFMYIKDKIEWFIETQWPVSDCAKQGIVSQLEQLRYLKAQYYSIDMVRTPRISPYGAHIGNFPRMLRKIILHDTIEYDIRYCHLAIFAWLTKAPLLNELLFRLLDDRLSDGSLNSFWRVLISELKLPYTNDIKDALKVIICAIIYGRVKRNTFKIDGKLTTDIVAMFTPNIRRRFYKHPIIKELFEYAKQQLNEISKNKQIVSIVTGETIPLDRFNEPNDPNNYPESCAFSFLLQEIELELLSGVHNLDVEESKREEPRFQIILMQHDGFSVKLTKEKYQNLVSKLLITEVDEIAKRLGIPTTLEAKKVKDELEAWMQTKSPNQKNLTRKEHFEKWKIRNENQINIVDNTKEAKQATLKVQNGTDSPSPDEIMTALPPRGRFPVSPLVAHFTSKSVIGTDLLSDKGLVGIHSRKIRFDRKLRHQRQFTSRRSFTHRMNR